MGEAPRLVRATEFTPLTGQTAGMTRAEAFHSERMWAGRVSTAAHSAGGWHHHGAYESVVYVLAGQVRFECGTGGRTLFDAAPGDLIVVPPGEVHRETNPGDTPSEILVVRAGQGAAVVNVDGPGSGSR